ncbi:hypothetical protein OVA00_38695 [Ensifer sp. SL37]|nr:hypothetical protein [Ensifer sp. SL37]MCY1746201.1 hypothetical protein [Ensifer sp. SL37]
MFGHAKYYVLWPARRKKLFPKSQHLVNVSERNRKALPGDLDGQEWFTRINGVCMSAARAEITRSSGGACVLPPGACGAYLRGQTRIEIAYPVVIVGYDLQDCVHHQTDALASLVYNAASINNSAISFVAEHVAKVEDRNWFSANVGNSQKALRPVGDPCDAGSSYDFRHLVRIQREVSVAQPELQVPAFLLR